MGYLALYIPGCLAPLVVWFIWRRVQGELPIPAALLCGYGWAAVLLAVFGIAAASDYGGCGVDPEPATVICTSARNANLVCKYPWAPGCKKGKSEDPNCPTQTGDYCPSTGGSWKETFNYCEKTERGKVAQEQSTWSDLVFICSALFILLMLDTDRKRSDWQSARTNFMLGPSVFSLIYAAIIVFMGPASMFLHAGMKAWGGFFDNYSIMLWLAFSLAYSLVRWKIYAGPPRSQVEHDRFTFMTFTLFVLFNLLIVPVSLAIPGSRDAFVFVFGIALGLNEAIQIGYLWAKGRIGASTPWLAYAYLAGVLVLVLVGKFVFQQSCESPTSALQGHPIFHTFGAGATFLTFLIWRLKPDTTGAGL